MMFRRTLLAPLALALVLFAGACEGDGTGPRQEQFTASLSGQAERQTNPVTTNATGTATFTVNGNAVNYTINVSNITGVTGAHIHGPATTEENAGVLVPLFANAGGTGTVNGVLAQGSFTSAQINPNANLSMDALLELMRNGRTYVNVHTTANKPGEIRGQIQRQ